MQRLQKFLRALGHLFRPACRRKVFMINRLPFACELSDEERKAIYGKEDTP